MSAEKPKACEIYYRFRWEALYRKSMHARPIAGYGVRQVIGSGLVFPIDFLSVGGEMA